MEPKMSGHNSTRDVYQDRLFVSKIKKVAISGGKQR
jgi:hypothetical protein